MLVSVWTTAVLQRNYISVVISERWWLHRSDCLVFRHEAYVELTCTRDQTLAVGVNLREFANLPHRVPSLTASCSSGSYRGYQGHSDVGGERLG